ncbi:MAG: hypothetical protein C0501_28010 [Isosphaera sp.]|nr:hypothetical protein [Isosphaera sp.]
MSTRPRSPAGGSTRYGPDIFSSFRAAARLSTRSAVNSTTPPGRVRPAFESSSSASTCHVPASRPPSAAGSGLDGAGGRSRVSTSRSVPAPHPWYPFLWFGVGHAWSATWTQTNSAP